MSGWIGKKAGVAPYAVQPYENVEKGGRLYLRWRAKGDTGRWNWRKVALRDDRNRAVVLRTEDGKVVKARGAWAQDMAEAKARELAETSGVGKVTPTRVAAMTIAQGKAAAFQAKTGKYPTKTAHRDEVARALDFAELTWRNMEPPILTWEQVRKPQVRALWRERIQMLRRRRDVEGHRGAEITVKSVLAVARWLRDEDLIPPGACVAPKDWKAQLKQDWVKIAEAHDEPAPKRPRHTIAEMRAIMEKAGEVDPRFAVIIAVGAEQRLGQVVRAWRSAYDREKGLFRIPSRGKKQGALLELTLGQRRVLEHALTEGYLRHLERLSLDYPLFPGTQLAQSRTAGDPLAVNRHVTAPTVTRMQLRRWFLDAESKARVPHLKGRGAYGLRRVAVDAAVAQKISADGLQAHGGWTNPKTPNEIYREQERVEARTEAKDVRAKIRGENT